MKDFSTDFRKDTSEALIFTMTVEQIRTVDTERVTYIQFADVVNEDAQGTKAVNATKQEVEEESFRIDDWSIFDWFKGD